MKDPIPPAESRDPNYNSKPAPRTNWQTIIEIAVFLVGIYVAYIYSGQLNQMIESNRINRDALQSVQRAFVTFSTAFNVMRIADPKTTKVIDYQLTVPMDNSG